MFERPGAVAATPLWYCTRCYGFWAPEGSIDKGVTGAYMASPALEALPAPRRCRACFGRLMTDGTCTKCGRPLPATTCPAGHGGMEPFEREGVTLDQCRRCHGVWFDMGELALVYHLSPAQALVAADSGSTTEVDVLPEWLQALDILSRLFMPLRPF